MRTHTCVMASLPRWCGEIISSQLLRPQTLRRTQLYRLNVPIRSTTIMRPLGTLKSMRASGYVSPYKSEKYSWRTSASGVTYPNMELSHDLPQSCHPCQAGGTAAPTNNRLCQSWWRSRTQHRCYSSTTAEERLKRITCSGCGSELQCESPDKPGYIPREKLLQHLAGPEANAGLKDSHEEENEEEEEEDIVRHPQQQLICKRCFSLKHYNTALNVTLQEEDYRRHLQHLRHQRALILLVVDVVDFPGSLLPDLCPLISPDSRVLVVGNKIDLLPGGKDGNFWKRLRDMILEECQRSSLGGRRVLGVEFTSVKTGEGLETLANTVMEIWGNRGDVYLLGCTNVGKSSLFNHLLVSICGSTPGQLVGDGGGGGGDGGGGGGDGGGGGGGVGVAPPAATISHWPGTTLGLLSFPLMSVGKRRRLLRRQAREARELGLPGDTVALPTTTAGWEGDRGGSALTSEPTQDRFWLHDTPGAIHDAQLINLLTTKELNLALPKKPLKPRTFLLHPGQCLMLGGLARLDYLDGKKYAYFTVFAASYIPVHVTRVSKADQIWANNLGKPLLKLPCGDADRLAEFPTLAPQLVSITGSGWRTSSVDVILSSAGWVAVTTAQGEEVCLMAHTPGGRGVYCRHPSLYPTAVNQRGKRSRNRNHRSTFIGQ